MSEARRPDEKWPTASEWLASGHWTGTLGTIAVLGAPLAKGSITPGRADLAPAAIREALFRFSTHDFESHNDIRQLSARDFGDLALHAMSPEEAFEPLAGAVAHGLEQAQAMVLLGGNNAITRGGVQGTTLALNRCGLLTIDAHLDLRDLDRGLLNGNPVRALLEDGLPGPNIAQVGIQSFANSSMYDWVARESGITVVPVEEVHRRGVEAVVGAALEQLARHVDAIYVDLDIDVLDRTFAPGTPGSRPGGLLPHQLRQAAYLCGRHPKVRAVDIVEVDPTQDVAGVTVMAAAVTLLSFASGVLTRLKAGAGMGPPRR